MACTEDIKNTSLKAIKIKTHSLLLLLCCSFVFLACKEDHTKEETKAAVIPTDTIYFAADSSQATVLRSLIQVYEGLNPYSIVIPIYDKEKTLYAYLKSNRVDFIFRSYNITEKEQEDITRRHLIPKVAAVWNDALAVIAHKDVAIDSISEVQLQDAIRNTSSRFKVVLDNANTSAYAVLNAHYFPEVKDIKAYAAGSEQAVIAQVKKDKTYLGLVSSVYFSGFHDAKDTLLKGVKVIGIVPSKGTSIAQYPFQDQIYNKVYPLAREITCINLGAKNSFGSSFVAFVLSERGQRIILKAGLLPATIPPRSIELK